MNFVEMTNEEWAEVYRRHDALVHMGELEMQTEEIREAPRAQASVHATKPVELQLHELDAVIADIQR
ncbi:MAG: hypothetical protein OJF55_002153 [Rhodanobacteraceae bacterium]|jgi:hypothetical protein|nr:MAG: hypothetical protein OJF55_002153 [Rhodanobacteraceae bacterium]